MKTKYVLAFMLMGIVAAGQAFAEKPATAGGHQKNQQRGQSEQAQAGAHGHFGDQHMNAVREYFSEEFRHGRCPPGLAKKDNGCMPPGLVKNWAVGQQLPRDVEFYDLPAALLTRLGQPPNGQRYVRVADDILLINPGSGLVIDAIPGLGMR